MSARLFGVRLICPPFWPHVVHPLPDSAGALQNVGEDGRGGSGGIFRLHDVGQVMFRLVGGHGGGGGGSGGGGTTGSKGRYLGLTGAGRCPAAWRLPCETHPRQEDLDDAATWTQNCTLMQKPTVTPGKNRWRWSETRLQIEAGKGALALVRKTAADRDRTKPLCTHLEEEVLCRDLPDNATTLIPVVPQVSTTRLHVPYILPLCRRRALLENAQGGDSITISAWQQQA